MESFSETRKFPPAVAGATALAAALILVGGCAGTPEAPDQALARAEVGIENAERSGARQFATDELDAAREKLTRARAAVDQEDMLAARRYAEQAEVDAELAAATARNYKAQESADELDRSIEVLREEIARNRMAEGGRQ